MRPGPGLQSSSHRAGLLAPTGRSGTAEHSCAGLRHGRVTGIESRRDHSGATTGRPRSGHGLITFSYGPGRRDGLVASGSGSRAESRLTCSQQASGLADGHGALKLTGQGPARPLLSRSPLLRRSPQCRSTSRSARWKLVTVGPHAAEAAPPNGAASWCPAIELSGDPEI
jgi:hypothetical protein